MEFSLNQFLNNPSGTSSSYMFRRDVIKKELETGYTNLLKLANNKFKLSIIKKGKSYLFWFKMPSESMLSTNFYYDVVLKFTPSSEEISKMSNILGYNITFFSNSASFLYTYTYAMNKYNLLIPELKTKYSKTAISQTPKVKNPVESLGFEKTIYYAALYIKNHELTSKISIDSNLVTGFKISDISSQESKIVEYKNHKSLIAANKRNEKKKVRDSNNEKIRGLSTKRRSNISKNSIKKPRKAVKSTKKK